MHALLITNDDRVVSEFKTIAAVTQTHLVIASQPTSSEINQAYRVFVSQELSETLIDHNDNLAFRAKSKSIFERFFVKYSGKFQGRDCK